MNKTTRYTKRVSREMASSRQALSRLMSKPRVSLEYGWSMARDCNATLRPQVRECLEHALSVHEPMFVGPRTYVRESANLCLSAHEPMFLFRRSHTGTVPVCHAGNKTGLRLALDVLIARASRAYRSCLTRLSLVPHALIARAPRAYRSCPTCLSLVVTLLLMMVVGVSEVKGQVTLTTNTDNPVYYLIQSFSNTGFYMKPNVVSNTTYVYTHSILTDDMKWFFLGVPGENGYYYICHKDGDDIKYMYFSDTTGSTNARVWIQLRELDDDDTDHFKFTFAKNNTQGWNAYNIIPKGSTGSYCLNKRGQNSQINTTTDTYDDGIQVSTAGNKTPGDFDDASCNWNFIALDNTYEWTLPSQCFNVSDPNNMHFYRIKSQDTTKGYIKPGTTYVERSTTEDDDMIWYFEEASSDDLMTYYYIKHVNTGKYLRFRISGAGSNATELSNHTGNETGDAEARFQFIVVRGTNQKEPVNDNCVFNIVPKLLKEASVKNINSLCCDYTILSTRQHRYVNTTHWTFEPVWGDPVVTCDETGTITITGEDGAAFYYTTDGSTVPTTANSQYNANSKPTVSAGTTTIKVRAIAAGKSDSRVITQKIAYNPNLTFASSTYDGTAQVPEVIVDQTTISSDEYNISYKQDETVVTECKNAGTYTVTITDKVGGEYIVYGSGTFTINKKTLTITAEAKSKTYGDADPALTYTQDGLVEGDAITGALSRAEGETVGTYAINQGDLSAGGNYNISFTGANLTITQNALTITANSDSKEYDGTALSNSGYTHTALAAGDVIESVTITGSQTVRGESENVPSAAVIKKGNNDVTTCYDISYVNGTLRVTGRLITITADSDSKVYDGTALSKNSYTYDATKLYSGDAIESVTVTGSQTVAGSSDNVPSAAVIKNGETDRTANYDFNYVNGTLTVNQREVGIEWGNTSLGYNGSAQVPTATATNVVNNDDVSVTVTGAQTDVGTGYTATATGITGAKASNYVFPSSTITTTFSIGPGTFTPTVSIDGWIYGGTSNSPSVSGNTSGGDVTYSYTVKGEDNYSTDVPTNAGEYTVKVTIAAKGNYASVEATTDFTISPKSIGDGIDAVEGIDIKITQVGENVEVTYVKDGDQTLVVNEDYTVEKQVRGDDNYIIVNGIGNYGGSVQGLFVKSVFTKPTEATQSAAVYQASSDLAKPSDIMPYIVRKVNPSIGTMVITPIGYIPKDVPVLMLRTSETTGFLASPKEESTDEITVQTKNSNMLKVVPEGGVDVEAAQVYTFYNGEFVLTKKGELSKGKFFLYNPNYTAMPSAEEEQQQGGGNAPSLSVLRFVIEEEATGIDDVRSKMEDVRDSYWYTLDGQRLNGKPTKAGLYIWNGRKTIIKRK